VITVQTIIIKQRHVLNKTQNHIQYHKNKDKIIKTNIKARIKTKNQGGYGIERVVYRYV
jgi:hypothetical protein